MRESNHSNKISVQTAFIAALKRTLIGFPIEYPLINISTLAQALPTENIAKLVKSQWQYGGISEFYRGGFVYAIKIQLRSTYHTTGIVFFRDVYKNFLSKSNINPNRILDASNIAAAFTMTTTSSIFINPLDRLRVYITTNKENKKYSHLLAQSFREINRGFVINYFRSTVSWTIFLVTEERLRLYLLNKKIFNNPSNQKLSMLNLLILGIVGGSLNLFLTLPLETITTQIQKAETPHKKIHPTMKYIYTKAGIRGFYSSIGVRLTQYILTTMLSSYALQICYSEKYEPNILSNNSNLFHHPIKSSQKNTNSNDSDKLNKSSSNFSKK